MVMVTFALIFLYGIATCLATCNTNYSSTNDLSVSDIHIYMKDSCWEHYIPLNNNSIIHSCTFCEPQCLVLWCLNKYSPNNATPMYDLDLEWILPTSNAPSSLTLYLCAYTSENLENNCSISNRTGIYKCVISEKKGEYPIHLTLGGYANGLSSTESLIAPTTILSNTFFQETLLSSLYASLMTSLSTSPATPPAISPVQSSTVPHYTGIGLLVATNLLTIIALISSCVYIFCQRKKSKFVLTENEQIALQNTSPQTEATSHNIETNPNNNNNTNITSGTNIYSSVEDEVDHYPHHHRPPARVASQYEVPLDLLQQAQVPLPPPPPLYASLDDHHDLTLPNPGYITNVIKEGGGGERGEGERREELDYSYATVNKFLKKSTEDTEYNKLQHD